METTVVPAGIDTALIERISTVVLAVGALAIFQHRSEDFYMLGRLLLVAGLVGYLLSQLLHRTAWVTKLERAIVLGMMIGTLGMFQAWDMVYYEYGFYLLGLSTLGFIIVSHLPGVTAQE
jgi:hypothetical protein